ncbi:MAG: hypothetical protein AAF483_19210 [Planctomycetota bacterium]
MNKTLSSILFLSIILFFTGCSGAGRPRGLPEEVSAISLVAYNALLFRKENGQLPENIDDIVNFKQNTPREDSWGNDFQFEVEGEEFWVRSAGADKLLHTSDDLSIRLSTDGSQVLVEDK